MIQTGTLVNGTTHATGGMQQSEISPFDHHQLVLDGSSLSVSTGRIDCVGASQLDIMSGSTYDFQGTSSFFNSCTTGGLLNEGTIIKSVAPGESWLDIPVISSGLIHVKTGTLSLSRQATISGDIVADSGATILFKGGQKELAATSTLNAERVRFESHISGSNVIRGRYNATVSTVQNGPELTFAEEATIINLNGTAPGTFDLLQVSGTATLAGTLNIIELGGFVPAAGDTFTVLTASIVIGQFDNVVGPSNYKVQYNPQEVTLIRLAIGGLDRDGDNDLFDASQFFRCFGGNDMPSADTCPIGVDADLDSDGDVDGADLRIFTDHF